MLGLRTERKFEALVKCEKSRTTRKMVNVFSEPSPRSTSSELVSVSQSSASSTRRGSETKEGGYYSWGRDGRVHVHCGEFLRLSVDLRDDVFLGPSHPLAEERSTTENDVGRTLTEWYGSWDWWGRNGNPGSGNSSSEPKEGNESNPKLHPSGLVADDVGCNHHDRCGAQAWTIAVHDYVTEIICCRDACGTVDGMRREMRREEWCGRNRRVIERKKMVEGSCHACLHEGWLWEVRDA